MTLLFGISTSVELFEGRLPRSSVSLLRGKYFELHGASNCVDHIYERIQAEGENFWLGRNITGVLFEKSSDYFQTPEAFCRTVKVSWASFRSRIFIANVMASTPICLIFSPIQLRYYLRTTFQKTYKTNSFAKHLEMPRLLESKSFPSSVWLPC